MSFLKEILPFVTIPTSLAPVMDWLVALSIILSLMVYINEHLKKLTENKLSFEKIVKGVLIGVRTSVQLQEGIEPWTTNRKIKKVGAYAFCAALGYGCIIFSALSISSVLMFILKKNVLTLDKAALAWGIILIFTWAARFAYVETRLAFKNAKSI
ncbi:MULTISPECIES: hypothetical protein [Acinetobacter calcoaceticus/baumannii complex]|uniref:hypothetical protein n=1 Tax=Acinetobacter calcoaceticus/baumannii complex TaxID=909768 RepID=UPI00197D0A04|nr:MULTISPECIES: hypothetical protein [Acinetobacter calcoaceticus/baumannii complex]MBN6524805.1 hypothetical protein [Acinetobacter pittii]MDH2522813.1 hypothetical protein [Acinetobacter baumannii]